MLSKIRPDSLLALDAEPRQHGICIDAGAGTAYELLCRLDDLLRRGALDRFRLEGLDDG